MLKCPLFVFSKCGHPMLEPPNFFTLRFSVISNISVIAIHLWGGMNTNSTLTIPL